MENVELKTWDDVDKKLRELGEAQIKIAAINGAADLAMNKVKADRERKLKNPTEKAENIILAIEQFCNQNKSEFTKKRTREMSFGKVSLRAITDVVWQNAATTIKALESLKMDECFKVVKSIVKPQLKKLDDNTLSRVGARKTTCDRLTIKPDIELLKKELKQ